VFHGFIGTSLLLPPGYLITFSSETSALMLATWKGLLLTWPLWPPRAECRALGIPGEDGGRGEEKMVNPDGDLLIQVQRNP
jgi:hypothetical protein